MRKVRTSLVLKPSVKKKLEEIANKEEESMSEIIQRAINEYIKDK